MQKNVIVLIGLLFALLIAGCGGNKSSSTTISGVTAEPITTSPTNTYYIKQIDDSSIQYTYNSLSNGNIVLTNTSDNKQYTFARIQTETDYWLVFDTSSYKISRLYLATPPSTYHPKYMGGSVQGTVLSTVLTSLASTITTPSDFCGSGSTTGGYKDDLGTSAQFNKPMSITYDGTYFYVADYANNMIRKVDSAGNVSTFAGNTSGTSGTADGTGTAAYFNNPLGITTDGENLYVADTGNHTIRRIIISTAKVETIAGVASSSGSKDSGEGASAYFSSPQGITTDGTNLYVADTGNYTIRKIQISGLLHPVSTIAGSAGNSQKDGEGVYTNAHFLYPTRLTTDGSNLYVVDFNTYGGSAIRKVVIATGAVSTLVGGYKTTTFGHLGGITTDGTYLYLGDGSSSNTNTYIRVVDKSSGSIIGTSPKDVTAYAGVIPPYGLTTNGTNLYFTSSYFNNIRYF